MQTRQLVERGAPEGERVAAAVMLAIAHTVMDDLRRDVPAERFRPPVHVTLWQG